MLDISLLELMGRAEEEVFAHEPGLGMDERHRILQLIAETEGAAGLVDPLRAQRRHARVWYRSQPLASTLTDWSGVSTCTAPRV